MTVDYLISPNGCGSFFAWPSANLVFEVLRLCLYGWGCPPAGCEVQIELPPHGMFRGNLLPWKDVGRKEMNIVGWYLISGRVIATNGQ